MHVIGSDFSELIHLLQYSYIQNYPEISFLKVFSQSIILLHFCLSKTVLVMWNFHWNNHRLNIIITNLCTHQLPKIFLWTLNLKHTPLKVCLTNTVNAYIAKTCIAVKDRLPFISFRKHPLASNPLFPSFLKLSKVVLEVLFQECL